MQKKLIALAVAGLSTAAFAQTNVTIYGVADVSAQGTSMNTGRAQAAVNNQNSSQPSGGIFGLKSNSSLLGFKGTEDLGNGLKGLFQIESNITLTGTSGTTATGNVAAGSTSAAGFGQLRDSYVGLGSKYGTGLAGFLSTPYRSALTSFDVLPGATGDGRIETFLGTTRLNYTNATSNPNAAATAGAVQAASSVRATAIAYALPTLYGFNGSIAYTGSNNNGGSNKDATAWANNTITTVLPQSALSMNLGWAGYGVDVKGAFQQAKVNGDPTAGGTAASLASNYTSYLIGAAYTGVPGLKASVVYNRNTVGTNANSTGTLSTLKGTNNQLYVGASYRFGNNEPRIAYSTTSNTSGLSSAAVGQDGGTSWTANWGYYLSKRTQVYGLVSGIKNNANGVWTPASGSGNLIPTGGQNFLTYGAGLRTNF